MRWFLVCIALLGIERLTETAPRPVLAQETLTELLAVAGPQWESLRKQNYSQLAIRVEEFEEHRAFEQNEIRGTRQSWDYFAAGDNKVIRHSRSSSISELEPSEQPLDSETSSWNFVTAQNARYGTDESKWTYQITDTEDAARGFIKKNRFVRPLSAAEQTQLAALCQLSSFDLPGKRSRPVGCRGASRANLLIVRIQKRLVNSAGLPRARSDLRNAPAPRVISLP